MLFIAYENYEYIFDTSDLRLAACRGEINLIYFTNTTKIDRQT